MQFQQLTNFFTENEEENDEYNLSKYFELSLKNKIIAFITCVGLGILLSIVSIIFLYLGNIKMFAVLYTFGNILSILSTAFVIGFKRQIQNMTSKTRIICTIVFFIFLVLTLLGAFLWKNTGLCIIFIIGQFLSYIWYCLSYIPYARTMVQNCLTSLV